MLQVMKELLQLWVILRSSASLLFWENMKLTEVEETEKHQHLNEFLNWTEGYIIRIRGLPARTVHRI